MRDDELRVGMIIAQIPMDNKEDRKPENYALIEITGISKTSIKWKWIQPYSDSGSSPIEGFGWPGWVDATSILNKIKVRKALGL